MMHDAVSQENASDMVRIRQEILIVLVLSVPSNLFTHPKKNNDVFCGVKRTLSTLKVKRDKMKEVGITR